MLPIQSAGKLFERKLELRSAREPGAMHTIAGPIDIAAPDAFKTEQHVTVELLPYLLQFIGKSSRRCCSEPSDGSKWPLRIRPFCRRNKLNLMPGINKSLREPRQIGFGT